MLEEYVDQLNRQKVISRKIQEAGGTAAVISWPEEAIDIIDAWRV